MALEPLCARPGAGDERPRARRLADELVELALHALDYGFTTVRALPGFISETDLLWSVYPGLAGRAWRKPPVRPHAER